MPLFPRLRTRIVEVIGMNFLSGYKTYIAAVGLAGLALYQLSQAQFELAMQSFLAALAAAGLRDAVAKAVPPAPPEPTPPPTDPSKADTVILPINRVTKLGLVAAAVLLLGGHAMASDSATRAKVALALAQAQASCAIDATATAPLTYAEARAEALAKGLPLVVWVGQPAQDLLGAVSVAVDQFDGTNGKSVVIGKPDSGDLMRFRTITGTPSAAAVALQIDCPDGKCPIPTVGAVIGGAVQFCPTCPRR